MSYYVYELIDPRDGHPFYVGKGKRERYLAHLKEAQIGKRSRKCDRIRHILEGGHEYQWRIVERFTDEQSAYDAEAALVDYHGLENLTNVMPGGGKAWEAYQRVRRAKKEVSSFDIVRICRNSILKAMVAKAIGLKIVLGGIDINEIAGGLVDKLKADVGDEYFYSYVPRFEIARAA